jgi:hypothetical protein
MVRVNVSMTNVYSSKLKNLSVACNMQLTTSSMKPIDLCLDSPYVIQCFQNKYNIRVEYRVSSISYN